MSGAGGLEGWPSVVLGCSLESRDEVVLLFTICSSFQRSVEISMKSISHELRICEFP
jgi:hypothetical protein